MRFLFGDGADVLGAGGAEPLASVGGAQASEATGAAAVEAAMAEDAQLREEIERLRSIAIDEFDKDTPSLQLVFECANALMECAAKLEEPDEVLEEAVHLYEELVDKRFNEQECFLRMSACHAQLAQFRQARESIERCLEIDSEWEPALQAKLALRHRVVDESKVVLLSFSGIIAAVALYFAWKRGVANQALNSVAAKAAARAN